MRAALMSVLAFLMLCAAQPALAQWEQDPNDHGEADTVDFVFSVIPCESQGILQLQADLWVVTDADTIIGVTMGFSWDNPNLQMDSATATDEIIAAFDLGRFFYEDGDINVTNQNQRFLFGGANMFSPGLMPDPNRRHWASYFFTLSDWSVQDSIFLDTLTFSAGSEYKFVIPGFVYYGPYWTGPHIVRDCDWEPPTNLVLTPDSLHFEGIEGGGNPPPQTFVVSSDGDPLSFELFENVGWIIPSPTQGSTDQTITVSINTLTLTEGEYIDSIRVEADEADNSPQYEIITLTISEPPPTICATPNSFFFNAIAGGDDPEPKTLTIWNCGSGVLEWTVSNSETWMGLDPVSGTDSGDVTVSIDITGLAFGDYFDTIVVSDPDATNDPKLIPVTLTVGSDLPVIEVDSAFNFVIIPADSQSVPPVEIVIRNGGAGLMNFWIEENSSRIFPVVPDSGQAPETVSVGIKTQSGSPGEDYFDTLWVFSNEAINSPFPVVFHMHFVENPAWMFLSRDTLRFFVFECSMGLNEPMPSVDFSVQNAGGDDPVPFQLLWESDLFRTNTDTGTAPGYITVTAENLGLPLGTYLDTITVWAPKAYNNPKLLVVKYMVIGGFQQPEIYTSDSLVIPTQENSGPEQLSAMSIQNVYGGCMPWELIEDVDWFFPNPTTGDVPGAVNLIVDATGYTWGQYYDTIQLIAPEAVNSPWQIILHMKVWRFRGDLNWDTKVNIVDLAYFVAYLFFQGPAPEPELRVADVNCDFRVNVADLTYLVAYLFENGPVPCRNPYKK